MDRKAPTMERLLERGASFWQQRILPGCKLLVEQNSASRNSGFGKAVRQIIKRNAIKDMARIIPVFGLWCLPMGAVISSMALLSFPSLVPRVFHPSFLLEERKALEGEEFSPCSNHLLRLTHYLVEEEIVKSLCKRTPRRDLSALAREIATEKDKNAMKALQRELFLFAVGRAERPLEQLSADLAANLEFLDSIALADCFATLKSTVQLSSGGGALGCAPAGPLPAWLRPARGERE